MTAATGNKYTLTSTPFMGLPPLPVSVLTSLWGSWVTSKINYCPQSLFSGSASRGEPNEDALLFKEHWGSEPGGPGPGPGPTMLAGGTIGKSTATLGLCHLIRKWDSNDTNMRMGTARAFVPNGDRGCVNSLSRRPCVKSSQSRVTGLNRPLLWGLLLSLRDKRNGGGWSCFMEHTRFSPG